MTTATVLTRAYDHDHAKKAPPPGVIPFRLPDPPERCQDEKMTSAKHLSLTGLAHYLAVHLGNPETTIVSADLYIILAPTPNMAGSRYPDLLVAFDANPEAYYRSNGYIISEQGKPPDLVLEIASPSTGRIDVTDKRDDYAANGIIEYWRFDETGRHHGARLAGDRLVNGRYVPIPITEVGDNTLQGRSGVLNLDFRWTQGRLGLYVPETGRHITTLAAERAARRRERAARLHERAARLRAEARIRELEETLRRLRDQ